MDRAFKKLLGLIEFSWVYLKALIELAFMIAWDVVTVKNYSRPGFVEVPLEAETDLEIAIIANLITFSPGTMVVGLSPDRSLMRVHVMFLEDADAIIQDIKENVEQKVLELLR